MTDLWMQRYETWRAAGFDVWESLQYMCAGRADWNWFDPVSFGPEDTYPWR